MGCEDQERIYGTLVCKKGDEGNCDHKLYSTILHKGTYYQLCDKKDK